MNNYHSNPIKDVKSLVDIEDVITFYSGDEFKRDFIKCPFHNERTASFSINKAKQVFHCFGCNSGGDCVDFVAKMFKLNNRQASELIDKDFNLGIYASRKSIYQEIKKYKSKKAEKELIEKWFSEAYLKLANYYNNNRNKKMLSYSDDTKLLLTDYLSDILLFGSVDERMEVRQKYEQFIRGL